MSVSMWCRKSAFQQLFEVMLLPLALDMRDVETSTFSFPYNSSFGVIKTQTRKLSELQALF